ncbi:MAG TPA: Holliday junction branch migration protein RuvA [Alphaproteobacteria bacterium]|jgi:Holliday junction DNA helicase RuvA|nr:Holliday junction branch migration protein RuvA [Alphaproteobacteria bacterium]
MIAKLFGQIDTIGVDYAVIDVNGVGYLVFCSRKLLDVLKLGQKQTLFVETHMREDHIHLYGFATESERTTFRLLTSVQGVGPKSALAIQSALTVHEIALSIQQEQKNLLMKANGIGAKLATRIVMELKDKWIADISLATLPKTNDAAKDGSTLPAKITDDAVSALLNLGYRRTDVLRAIDQVTRKNPSSDWTLSILIRHALAELSL